MSPEAAAYTENLIAAQGADDTLLDSSLTPEQRAKVFAWIEDGEEDLTSSVKRIFAEFGVKVSKIAVRAFYRWPTPTNGANANWAPGEGRNPSALPDRPLES